ncbi:MAG: class I SAM-dependent methyltransferase [Pseudonocardia sp.]
MTVPSIEQIAARWSAHAERYHRWGDLTHGHPAYRNAWIDALAGLVGHPGRDGSPPLRIADIGTGTAEIALLLAGMGHDVTGYDIAPGMLAVAQAKADAARVPSAGVTVRFEHGDAYDLPLADAAVDVVINRMVFWTLHDPGAALREWRRVLAPGGRIVVIDALHFATPTTVRERAHRVRERAFWTTLGRFEHARDRLRYGRRNGRSGQYRSDAVQPPGMRWQGVADAKRHFTEAGLSTVIPGRLDTVADAHRRTASLRWRAAGLLPRFFTLTWTRR